MASDPSKPGHASLERAVCWLALFAFSVWVWLAVEQRLAAEVHGEGVAAQLYLLKLTAVSAPWIGVPWAGARFFAQRSERARVGAPFALGLLAAWAFWRLAAPIADGDGVQALPISPWFVSVLAGVVGLALTLTLWACQHRKSAFWCVVPQAALVGGLIAVTLAFDRTYASIAGATLMLSALATANLLERALVHQPGAARFVALGMGATLAIAVLWGAVEPARMLRGRQRVLADQRVPIELDSALFGADAKVQAAVTFNLEGFDPASCKGLPKTSREPALGSDPARRRNVLLISIDALRRDVIGMRVQGKRVAPNLFAWAQRAQVVKYASTSYAATLLSVTGAMTGLPASRTLLLPKPPRTLFQGVRSQIGRRIAILPKTNFFQRPGFQRYALRGAKVKFGTNARRQTNRLLKFIQRARSAQERFLAWVHYGEPHEPYRRNKKFQFGKGEKARYFGEVAYVDAQFGRLMGELAQAGTLDNTLVIVFADHGEALGERGYYGHHVFLNRWVAEVPLFLHVPSGEQIPAALVAQTTDIAPTVYHFLGIKPPHPIPSRSLLAASASSERAVFAEAFSVGGPSLAGFAQRPITTQRELAGRMAMVQDGFGRYPPSVSITEGDHRLIVNRRAGFTTLYNTARDPKEQHDLSLEQPALRDALLRKLADWHREQSVAAYCAVQRSVRKKK